MKLLKTIVVILLLMLFVAQNSFCAEGEPKRIISHTQSKTVVIWDVDDVLVTRGYEGKWKEYWALFKEMPGKRNTLTWLACNACVFAKNIKLKTVPDLIDWFALHNKALHSKSSSGKTFCQELKELIAKGKPIQQTIDIMVELKKQGYNIAIATNQDRYTFDHLVKIGVLPRHDLYCVIYTKDSNQAEIIRKPDHRYFIKLNSQLNDGLQDMRKIFIDDKQANIDAAKQCNIEGIRYKNTAQLSSELRAMGLAF